MKSWFGFTPWRRATRLTEAPGSWLSSTMRIFSAALQRRRLCTEVTTSTFSGVSVIRTVILLTLTGMGDRARSVRGQLHEREAGSTTVQTRADPALLKALARAFRYQRLLDEGRYASVSEMAAAERIERGYLGTLLRLTLLAPDIVQAVLDGRQPDGVTLPRLLEPFPAVWTQQGREVQPR